MTDNNVEQKELINKNPIPAQKKPNEIGSIHVEGFIRIYDPNTKEVYLESRA